MAQRPSPISVLLRSEETNGVLSVMDNWVSAGFPGPPLHHHDFDETFQVLEGELTFQVVDELVTARAGELVFAPRGVAHTFANLSAGPARVMLVCTPAGFERYFARMAAEHEGVDPPEWALQPTPPVTVVGPRIGERARR
jgi:mannose-6-phosphate isomerase-like protein (cupin superfamily)